MTSCSRGQLVKHRYKPPHVCLLMHVGAAQARTRGGKERHGVTTATQVREKQTARASYDAL
jgi:hypothetical protein